MPPLESASQTTRTANGNPQIPHPTSLKFRDGRPMVQVDDETDCWIWLGARSKGYGKVSRGGRSSVQAHKWLYESIFGPVRPDYDLGHTCHRRSCVNPSHVRPITKLANKREQCSIPVLSGAVRTQIEEWLLEDFTNSFIAAKVGISIYAVRRIAREVTFKNQLSLK